MKYRFLNIILFFVLTGFMSCQDKENREDSNVDLIPAEEKSVEDTAQDRPMERSYTLAKMRENNELSSFTQELQQSGLEEEFEGKEGIYTFFAPSNAAFDRIPARDLERDSSEDAVETRRDRLRYYMVEGDMTLGYLREQIRTSEDDAYEFETALGEKLWATEEGGDIVLTDVLGNKARILTSEMDEYRGAYHVIDNVLQPGEE
ncbi:fasciclin domain-containing protein [Salinimicrobium marinum]|nr:fasciclin domain-containing protein [Salinimicrobium marinum]